MSTLSEEAYAAGWMQHLEYALWHAVLTGPMRYGRLDLTEHEIQTLRQKSDACGGWIHFDEDTGEQWLPLADWETLYSASIDAVNLD